MNRYSFIKKPLFWKKIRTYNDLYKKEDFVIKRSSDKSNKDTGLVTKFSFLDSIFNGLSKKNYSFFFNKNNSLIFMDTKTIISKKNILSINKAIYEINQNIFQLLNFSNFLLISLINKKSNIFLLKFVLRIFFFRFIFKLKNDL